MHHDQHMLSQLGTGYGGLQEMSTAALHYCEMVTALGVLSPGGSFILKAFTLFEHPTVCALHLMGALFQEVHVYKPATSKPGNSETYIIGKQFKVTVIVCICLTCKPPSMVAKLWLCAWLHHMMCTGRINIRQHVQHDRLHCCSTFCIIASLVLVLLRHQFVLQQ
jgi:hypothetical protein